MKSSNSVSHNGNAREGLVTDGRYTGWIRLHPCDARFLRLADDFRRDGLMKVERHVVLDVWLDCSQSVPVFEALLDGCDGWDKIWLNCAISE